MDEREFEVLLTDRGGGKTTEAMGWLNAGVRTRGYPGWTRVLVTSSARIADLMRKEWRGRVEDLDHRVYTLREWREAQGVNPDTEVRLDDAEMMLPQLPGRLTGITLSGQPWQRGQGKAPYPEPISLRALAQPVARRRPLIV